MLLGLSLERLTIIEFIESMYVVNADTAIGQVTFKNLLLILSKEQFVETLPN
jgi:hypothetical protein